MSGKGLRISQRNLLRIIAGIVAASVLAVIISKELNESFFGRGAMIFEDIWLAVNSVMLMWIGVIFAAEVSEDMSKGEVKQCDSPFGLINYLSGRQSSAVLSAMGIFIFSYAVFSTAHLLAWGRMEIGFLQGQICSFLSLIPLLGIGAAAAIWLKPRNAFLSALLIIFAVSFFGGENIPSWLAGIVPDMDLYQSNLGLSYVEGGAWLYLFSMFAIGLVWNMTIVSASAFVFNASRGLKKYPTDSGIRIYFTKAFILIASVVIGAHIAIGLKSAERGSCEKLGGKIVLPRSGFQGIWAELNVIRLYELFAARTAGQMSESDLRAAVSRFETVARIKPSFDPIFSITFHLITALDFDAKKKNETAYSVFCAYLANPYIKRDAMFEYMAASTLVSPMNPDSKKYMLASENILKGALKLEVDSLRPMISRRILALKTQAVERGLRIDNKNYAELIVWHEEWKKSLDNRKYESFASVVEIENSMLKSADNAEKTADGDVNILSAVENVRRKLLLVKYIRERGLPSVRTM
jgi:hypothetical protein